MGLFYTLAAFVLGGIFLMKAWALLENPLDQVAARSLFKYSIFYMMLLSAGMAVDSLPITHTLTHSLVDSFSSVTETLPISQIFWQR
jgi:protoheme IX farnesyltransferase